MTITISANTSKSLRYLWGFAVIVLLSLTVSPAVHSRKVRKEHVVQSGESIAKIADHYGVSQRDLRELNKWPKGKPLRIGQKLKIPNVLRVAGKKYKVKQGDTLASIGKKFNRTTKAIAHANKLSVDAPLSLGRVLVIPDKVSEGANYAPKEGKAGEILFLRVRTGERERIRLYYNNGKINKNAVMRLSRLSKDNKTKKVKRLNSRLIYLLQKIGDHFDSHTIEIISGYREQSTGNESQHAFGRAMDIRIPGASTKAVYQFCRKLPRSGCGYYPGDGFVHVDAREKKTFWIGK